MKQIKLKMQEGDQTDLNSGYCTKAWILGKEHIEVNQVKGMCESANWHALTIQDLEYFENLVNTLKPDILFMCSDVIATYGRQLTRELTRLGHKYAIIGISKKEDIQNAMECILEGASDIIQCPFTNLEIHTRSRRAVHSLKKELTSTKRLHSYNLSEIIFNPETQTLEKNDHIIKLTEGETDLLQAFCLSKGIPLRKEEIGVMIGCKKDSKTSRTIDMRISKLRKKLKEAGGDEDSITHIRSEGYRLTSEIEKISC